MANDVIRVNKAVVARQSVVWGPPLVAMLIMVVVAVLYLGEQPPILYLDTPFPTSNPVRQGGRINPHVFHCDDVSLPIFTITARRLVLSDPSGPSYQLEQGSIYYLPPVPSTDKDRGCAETITDEVVPETVPPGSYVLETYTRASGRWRDHIILGLSQPFDVLPSIPSQGPAGPKGETGETGASGPQGETGPIGPQGETGPESGF